MSDKGRFSGFCWHNEFHNVNKKKGKAADCIYLTTDRMCQNKKSTQYLNKCFIASSCPVRKRENEISLKETKVNNSQKIKKINCTLPVNCSMFSERLGKGKYVGYNEEQMIISVQFGDKTKLFQYPDAILNKHLTVPKSAFKQVLSDISKAEKG